jgi:hypothetical protein
VAWARPNELSRYQLPPKAQEVIAKAFALGHRQPVPDSASRDSS